MFLLFNLSVQHTIHLALFDAEKITHTRVTGKNRDLLEVLEQFLFAEQVKKEDVKGIAVVLGAGSFTSTRIGTVIANVFGYVRGIPLLGITADEAANVQSLIPRLLAEPAGQYISATYSGAPNITKSGR